MKSTLSVQNTDLQLEMIEKIKTQQEFIQNIGLTTEQVKTNAWDQMKEIIQMNLHIHIKVETMTIFWLVVKRIQNLRQKKLNFSDSKSVKNESKIHFTMNFNQRRKYKTS